MRTGKNKNLFREQNTGEMQNLGKNSIFKKKKKNKKKM